MKNFLIIVIITSICNLKLLAQKQYNLQECVEIAIQNNLQVKQGKLQNELAEQNYNQSRAAVLPNISANASHVYNYGQTIDRYTNQFANQRVQSDNLSLNGNMNLFSGFQLHNRQQQGKYDYLASKYDVEKVKNDIALNVVNAYLEILFSKENIKIAESQLAATQTQADRIKKLVKAGSLPKANELDIEAQVARENNNLVIAENRLSIAKLNLKQIMMVDERDIDISVPATSMPTETIEQYNTDVVYNSAISGQPDVKAAETRIKSAEKGISINQGAYSPSLILFGSLATGYSGLQREAIGSPFITGTQTIGVTSNGLPVFTPVFDVETRVTPISKQFKNNFNQTVGLQLSIPIFSQFNNKIAVNRAKIAKSNAEIQLEQTKQNLRNTIERAYNTALAAYKAYGAAEKSVEAMRLSYNYAEQRFTVGAINSVEFNNTKNQLNQAESQLIQNKYEYIFRLKILDFYLGKPLNF